MTKPIIASAREIAADLRAHENDVDATLAGQARLISRLIEARKSAGLPAMVGAEIVDQLLEGDVIESIGGKDPSNLDQAVAALGPDPTPILVNRHGNRAIVQLPRRAEGSRG